MTGPMRLSGVIARRIADETILVPSTRRAREMALFTLNEVGTFVWEQLDGRRDAASLACEVAKHFDVAGAEAERDVVAFLAELGAAGCLGGGEAAEEQA